MLTTLLLAAIIIYTIVSVCTVVSAAGIIFVLFGDVLIAMLILASIVKIQKHFKAKKNKNTTIKK